MYEYQISNAPSLALSALEVEEFQLLFREFHRDLVPFGIQVFDVAIQVIGVTGCATDIVFGYRRRADL